MNNKNRIKLLQMCQKIENTLSNIRKETDGNMITDLAQKLFEQADDVYQYTIENFMEVEIVNKID